MADTCFASGLPKAAGLGLRMPHIPAVLQQRPEVAWFELLADNHLPQGSFAYRQACAVAEVYPVCLHSVNMNLAGVDALDFAYLQQLKWLQFDTSAAWISDHACFTCYGGAHSHDLLPLPFTEEAVAHLAQRITQVQDFLGRSILLENVSSSLQYQGNEMTESDFLIEVANRSNCRLLVDINNYRVNEINFAVDAWAELEKIPGALIAQIHIAGFEKTEWGAVDTHGAPVSEEVWQLLAKLLQRHGTMPSMLERDNDLPKLAVLLQEYEQLSHCLANNTKLSPQAGEGRHGIYPG